MARSKEVAVQQLENQIYASGNALGQVMAAARQRLTEAKKTKSKGKIKSALAFYNRCAAAMQNALNVRIKKIDDSSEMRELIGAFKAINGDLKAEAKMIKDLKNGLQKATRAVKSLEKYFRKTLDVLT